MIKTLQAKIDGRQMEDDFEIIDAILDSREITDTAEFLRPTEDNMVPFECMMGLDEAYQMIDDAIVMDEKFLVHHDIDSDGASGGAIMTRYLRARGADVKCAINKGKKHGVSEFDLSLLDGIDVMIVIDSIDNDPEVYQRIVDTGTKLCVIDHHIIENRLLESDVPFALVSSANKYPNSELSGAGCVLKVVQYCDYMNLETYVDDLGLWLYAAIGIVADMCSMRSPENRYIVYRGLGYFNNPLVKKMVGNYLFDSTSISFSIAPLINAAMRTGNNETAMNVFHTDDEDEINDLVNQMKGYREFQNKVVDELMEDLMIQAESQMDRKCMFFMLPTEIDAEVSGLLANKILSIVQRPLCVLRNVIEMDKETGEVTKCELSGSMRACGVESFKEYIEKTGYGWVAGHENAAGVGFSVDEFEDFKVAIEEALKDVTFSTTVVADIELTPDQINENLVRQLSALSRISGKDFPAIKILVRTDDYEVSTFSTKKHLKVIDESGLLIVKWNCLDYQTMKNDKQLVAVGTLSSPRYGKTQYLQLTVDEYTQQND